MGKDTSANSTSVYTLPERIILTVAIVLSVWWLLTHMGCAHPIGNLIAVIVYLFSATMLALPWVMRKLEPYLTEEE